MSDPLKQKYQNLMVEIDDLECDVEVAQKNDPDAPETLQLMDMLAEKRNELARISSGCGTGR